MSSLTEFRGLCPYILIPDGRAPEALSFYKAAFAAEQTQLYEDEPGRRIMHCEVTIAGSNLAFNDAPEGWSPPGAGPISLHLEVDDADVWWQRAVAAGCTPTIPLADQEWGARWGQLADPFGVTWAICCSAPGS